mmetsp:Transcript_11305/g.16609  ORF Transcript_11305/g.16609 Transcript_11305/m.16609 type:complete len:292 (+) Transcript_11305:61-936(+)
MISTAIISFFLIIGGSYGFLTGSVNVPSSGLPLFSATEASATTFPVKRIVTDQDIVDLASFRNDLTNPEMMVENSGLKSAGVDNTESAIKGLKIGFLYIGVPLAVGEYFNSGQDLNHAIEIYFSIGGLVGLILGINNYMGKSVFLPSLADCENRIIVDYAEGLKRKYDVGFVAIAEKTTKFEPCGGIMACVDGQLRNSRDSPKGVQTVDGFPIHFHLKNMLVYESMRRQGVGVLLMDAFEKYAREETDAELLTLEVEEDNTGAIRLYEKAGFTFTKNPTTFTKRKFMSKKL